MKYRGDSWLVIGKSPLPQGWWIQRTVDGKPTVVEALRKELSQA